MYSVQTRLHDLETNESSLNSSYSRVTIDTSSGQFF
jgi:hypothetical protein